MKDFLANLSTLYWWISVVVVGVLINLASAYLKTKLDKRLSRVSDWWRVRSEAQKAQRNKQIRELRTSPHEQIMLTLSELRNRIRGIFFAGMGIAFAVFAIFAATLGRFAGMGGIIWTSVEYISMTAFSLSMLLAYRMFISASSNQAMLVEACKSEESEALTHNRA